jgi:hypothetical protein
VGSRIVFPDLGLLVRECRFGSDDRLLKLHINDLGLRRQFLHWHPWRISMDAYWLLMREKPKCGAYPDSRESQSLDIRSQGAEVGPQETWQHINALIHKIYSGAPRRRFRVHRVIGKYEVRYVSNICFRDVREGATLNKTGSTHGLLPRCYHLVEGGRATHRQYLGNLRGSLELHGGMSEERTD